MEMKIKLKPMRVPNYILSEPPVGKRQDGFQEPPKFALSEIDADTLDLLCDQFREDVFKKAGKDAPTKQPA